MDLDFDEKYFAALNCTKAVTWSNDIAKLFTAADIDHMRDHGIDLGSYDDVKDNAVEIYRQVYNKKMPKPGSGESPWSAQSIETFGC